MIWDEARRLHAEAATELVSAAEAIPTDRWLLPRADGKWSPAEIVEHLTLAYDVLLRELGGGPGMQIRTTLWQRLLLRLTLFPKILRGEPFPANARAPREMRPAMPAIDQPSAIARFRDLAARFDSETREVRSGRLTHAYFGRSSVQKGVILCARHVQHHLQQLREII